LESRCSACSSHPARPAPREPGRIVANSAPTATAATLTGSAGPNLLDTYGTTAGDDAGRPAQHPPGAGPSPALPPFGAILSDEETQQRSSATFTAGREFAAGRGHAPAAAGRPR